MFSGHRLNVCHIEYSQLRDTNSIGIGSQIIMSCQMSKTKNSVLEAPGTQDGYSFKIALFLSYAIFTSILKLYLMVILVKPFKVLKIEILFVLENNTALLNSELLSDSCSSATAIASVSPSKAEVKRHSAFMIRILVCRFEELCSVTDRPGRGTHRNIRNEDNGEIVQQIPSRMRMECRKRFPELLTEQ
ncbi:hypothetical protein TNCV_450701 [Trichonephila clavipes]|nr:hypothetical protein TNCV_450701 [Trichonephila clavipes]